MLSAFQFRRIALLGALLILGFVWLEYRLVDLQILRHEELLAEAERYTRTVRRLEPVRGEIRDRNGRPLVVSGPVKTVYANLALCTNRLDAVARTAAPLLALEAEPLGRLLREAAAGQYEGYPAPLRAVVLRRNVGLAEWRRLTNAMAAATFGLPAVPRTRRERLELGRLQRHALFAQDDQVRRYPLTNALSSVLGMVARSTNGAGWVGVSGLEKLLDAHLAGVPGLCLSRQNAAGRELPFARTRYQAPLDGRHVRLTVDARLQAVAEAAAQRALTQHRARQVSILVVHPQTGEVLAWAQSPALNLAAPGSDPEATWRNVPIQDLVEPGSTFKIVVLAAALEAGLTHLDDRVFCENGRLWVQGSALRDHDAYGWLTTLEGFAKSSNVLHAKLALLLGPEPFRQELEAFGFGARTGIELPGESRGLLPAPASWSKPVLVRLAIGQGVGVTQLQMAMAYCALANDGRLMQPRLLRQVEAPDGTVLWRSEPRMVRQVVSSRTAALVRRALEAVVEKGGTGQRAALPLHRVAGKTGTAQKADQSGYLRGRYHASFIGFLPASAPQLCIAVAVDEPAGDYYGGVVAAPVFREVAEQAVGLFHLPPDRPTTASNELSNVLARR